MILNPCFELVFPLMPTIESTKSNLASSLVGYLLALKKFKLYHDFLKGSIDKVIFTKFRNVYDSLVRNAKKLCNSQFFENSINKCYNNWR